MRIALFVLEVTIKDLVCTRSTSTTVAGPKYCTSLHQTMKRWEYILPRGSLLQRYETDETRKDVFKFYSYFRNPSSAGSPWGKRCRKDNCTFLLARPKNDPRLIALPYKTFMFEDEVTEEDKKLAEYLFQLTSPTNVCTREAIAIRPWPERVLATTTTASPITCQQLDCACTSGHWQLGEAKCYLS